MGAHKITNRPIGAVLMNHSENNTDRSTSIQQIF